MPAKATARPRYSTAHNQRRAAYTQVVLSGGARCARCGDPIIPGEPWDLGHVDGDPSRYSGPEHRRCNRATASRLWQPAQAEAEPEREGIARTDRCWAVPWLKGLRRPPADATWPRYMTVPHPRAVSSIGRDFIRHAERREGRPLRWWQRLVAMRMLEVDAAGRLVWETVLLTMSRQLGKSWLLRELCLWRIHQGGRFGEPQVVLHTGMDVAVCNDMQVPARAWARARPGEYKVREVNGREQIELLEDGSCWKLLAKGAVYGFSSSLGLVDEAWKVDEKPVEEGLYPTMVERQQPQLLLVSTAHRLATPLMLRRRALALEHLETGDGDLLMEWSAPAAAGADDVAGWRAASPHWTPQRERMIGSELERLHAGQWASADEPDPEASFRAQWCNQWPRPLLVTDGLDALLPPGLWAALAEPDPSGGEPVLVALEDDYGKGAGVAAVARLPDGRLEVDGWACAKWDDAVASVLRLAAWRDIHELHVGASMLDRLPLDGTLPRPRPAIAAQTAAGLAVFRDLAASYQLVHDTTTGQLDQVVAATRVRESPSGLQIARGPRALVKALVWAVAAAHRPTRVPAIH